MDDALGEARRRRDAALRLRQQAKYLINHVQSELDRRREEARRRAAEVAQAKAGATARPERLRCFEPDLCLLDDREMVLAAVVDAAMALTSAEMGTVQLYDPEAGGLRIVAQRGFGPAFLEYFALVDDSGSACGAARRLGEPVIVEDVARSPVFDGNEAGKVVLAAGVRAVQSIPLVSSGGPVLGVFSVHYRRPHRRNASERRLLDVLAASAGRRLVTKPAGQDESG